MPLSHNLALLQSFDLIRLQQERPELAYMFRHALVQEAAYNSLLLADRQRWHRQVAEQLQALYPEREPELAATLAQHFDRAGDEPTALTYYRLAAETAAAIFANEEALGHYRRALLLARQLPEQETLLVELCPAIGRIWELLADYPSAMAHYREMEVLAGERASRPLQLAAWLGQAKLLVTASPLQDLEQGAKLSSQALELAESLADRMGQVQCHWLKLHLLFYAIRYDEAAAIGEKALALARRWKLTEQEAFILNDMALVYNNNLQMREAIEMYEQAGRVWRALENLPMLVDSLAGQATSSFYLGRFQESLTISAEGVEIAGAIGARQVQAYVQVLAGLCHWYLGRPAAALASNSRCLTLAQEVGFPPVQAFSHISQSTVYNYLGNAELAARSAEAGLALANNNYAPFVSLALVNLAEARLQLGDQVGAQQILDKAQESGPRRLTFDLQLRLLQVRLWLLAGRLEPALGRLLELEPTMDAAGILHLMPELLLIKARLQHLLDRPVEARDSLQRAHNIAESCAAAWHLWQVLAARAELAEEPAEARRLMNQAVTILQPIIDDTPPEHRPLLVAQEKVGKVING